jgi:hypothetical protein
VKAIERASPAPVTGQLGGRGLSEGEDPARGTCFPGAERPSEPSLQKADSNLPAPGGWSTPLAAAYAPDVVSGTPETDLASDFAAIARVLGSAADLERTLDRIVDAAIAAVQGCEHAGIFILENEEIRTVAASDPLVEQLHTLQQETGEGPCLDAVVADTPYNYAEDLLEGSDYPSFGPRAAASGIRSSLALRLLTDHRIGSLNLYAGPPRAFSVLDRAKAVILASHASTALDAAATRARTAASSERDLHDALASRGIIGQAQGILMERERITAEHAFDVLRHASQDLNVKLRDVAQRVVDTGEDPRPRSDPGPPDH